MPSEQSVAISVDVFAERKTESFQRRDSILRIRFPKRFGRLMRVMACSQITGAIMLFLATKMVGHLFENLFFRRGKNIVFQTSVWRLVVWKRFLGI